MANMNQESIETIVNIKRNDMDALSAWSQQWSTEHIPGMDMATGSGGGATRRRKSGRRRLRIAALSLGCMLTMHVRVTACSLSGGYFVFMLLLIPTVGLLANPLRYFEVYLGQWSISGPGRAFRIIPMFDGIGMSICIHAIVRAIFSVMVAAISAIYVMHSVSDLKLPFTYCRDMNLKEYEPTVRYITAFTSAGVIFESEQDIAFFHRNNISHDDKRKPLKRIMKELGQPTEPFTEKRPTEWCNETYPNNYPPIFQSPSYNFFYVELLHYRPDHDLNQINIKLVVAATIIWCIIWLLMIIEKLSNGKMIWNNMYPWFVFIPLVWSVVVMMIGTWKFFSRTSPFRNVFHIGGHKEILDFATDVFIVSTYIHAATLGSEIIHGKGLNFYASGQIDPDLQSESMWHSAALLTLTAMTAGGVAICAHTDYMQMRGVNTMLESTLWIMPLYSKCAINGNYAHLSSTVIFAGLTFSYITVAFVCIKSAMHTIFEYRVKLVFVEQYVVAILMIACMGLSVLFTTNAGLGLLEGLDMFMAGIATPLLSALELSGLLYVYRGRDFMSDMHVSNEENVCTGTIGIQWQILPFLQIVLLILEATVMASCEIPSSFMWIGAGFVALVILLIPIRSCINTYLFLHPQSHRPK